MSRILFLIGCFPAFASIATAGLIWENDHQDIQPTAFSKQAEARFKFKNSGPHEVKIISVKSSCGCVGSVSSKNGFTPGETGEVAATFVFGDRTGQQEKTVVVQTNDPDQPVKVLWLRVFIPQPIEIRPSLVLWRIGEKPEAKRMEVQVQSGAETDDFTATSSNPEIKVRLEKDKIKGRYSLIVIPKETTHPKSAFIRLETGGSDPKSFVAHVRVK